MKTLAVANQKSVGKSTIAFHLAHAGAEAGLRVLIVTFDAQGSLELVFPAIDGAAPGLLASALFEEAEPSTPLEYLNERVAIIRADQTMFALDTAPESFIRRPKMHLRRFAADFDLCIIDTPGRICMPLNAALTAADVVLCPVSMGLFEIAALADLWKFIQAVRKKGYNPQLRLMGILPNKINTKSKEELQGLADLRQQFGTAIMPEMLTERAAVKQATSRRRPVWFGTKGAGHRAAGVEWKSVCNSILVNLGSIPK